jgi:hypothetical protein
VSIRRLFWLGAAVLFSIAALVAIAAVVGGGFGETQGHILATCGLAFVCGAAALSGFACLDRGIIRPAALSAIALGVSSFVLWTVSVWKDPSSSGFWKATGVVGAWMFAALIVTALRLVATSPRLIRTSVPATWAAAVLAAALGSVMILRRDGGAWQLELVLVILTALGCALTPVLQRFWAGAEAEQGGERLLGRLGEVDVFAVRGQGRSVIIGSTRTSLASSEGILLRPRS